MSEVIVKPRMRGFIALDAHPAGCAANVARAVEGVAGAETPVVNKPVADKPVVVVGASTGYGLASATVAGFGWRAPVLGVGLERPPERGRTASAGWYNVAELHRQARERGARVEVLNGDCFSSAMKETAVEALRKLGGVGLLVYSVAAPVRTDPVTGERYRSVLKPVGSAFSTKTIHLDTGEVVEVELPPATREEVEGTRRVMGGEDWSLWIDALDAAGLLSDGFRTVAYTYIGPMSTAPIYRSGSIGRAKADLEATADRLHARLAPAGGGAWASVNGAAITQSSAAIPAVPLYLSVLLRVAGSRFESPNDQIVRLFDGLLGDGALDVDDERRVRLDGWELAADLQEEVAARWQAVTSETLPELGDFAGFRRGFRQLFGFDVDGVDYDAPVEVDVPLG